MIRKDERVKRIEVVKGEVKVKQRSGVIRRRFGEEDVVIKEKSFIEPRLGEYLLTVKNNSISKTYLAAISMIKDLVLINILEQLKVFSDNQRLSDVKKVIVDGIYYTGETVELKNSYRKKDEDKKIGGEPAEKFCIDRHGYYKGGFDELFGEAADDECGSKYVIRLGGGGSGKSYHSIMDKGFKNILFLSFTNKEVRSKVEMFNNINDGITRKGLTVDKFLANDYNHYKYSKYKYSKIIIDEVGMLTIEKLESVLEKADCEKVEILGDLDNQILNDDRMTVDYLKKRTGGLVVNYNKDYRSVEGDEIREVKKKAEELNKNELKKYLIDKGCSIGLEEAIQECKYEDIWIAGRKRCAEGKVNCNCDGRNTAWNITEALENKFKKCKYLAIKTTKDYSAGDIIENVDANCEEDYKEKRNRFERTFCYTIHSYQGQTVELDRNLYIMFNSLWDSRMIYTAISRVKSIKQLKVVF